MGSVRSKHQVRIAREYDVLKATVHIGKKSQRNGEKVPKCTMGVMLVGVRLAFEARKSDWAAGLLAYDAT